MSHGGRRKGAGRKAGSKGKEITRKRLKRIVNREETSEKRKEKKRKREKEKKRKREKEKTEKCTY